MKQRCNTILLTGLLLFTIIQAQANEDADISTVSLSLPLSSGGSRRRLSLHRKSRRRRQLIMDSLTSGDEDEVDQDFDDEEMEEVLVDGERLLEKKKRKKNNGNNNKKNNGNNNNDNNKPNSNNKKKDVDRRVKKNPGNKNKKKKHDVKRKDRKDAYYKASPDWCLCEDLYGPNYWGRGWNKDDDYDDDWSYDRLLLSEEDEQENLQGTDSGDGVNSSRRYLKLDEEDEDEDDGDNGSEKLRENIRNVNPGKSDEADHHNRLLVEEEYTFQVVAWNLNEEGLAAGQRKYSVYLENANGLVYEIEEGSGVSSAIPSGAIVTLPPQAYLNNTSGKINLGGGELAVLGPSPAPGPTTGTKTIVAVRVIAIGAGYNWADEAGLSDDVFGTSGDIFNLKTGYEQCSHGQLTINPGGSDYDIVNGVTTITVDVVASLGNDVIMHNAVTKQINAQFGVSKPTDIADHWMYCLPPNVMVGVAYATVNGWRSVYSNEWCNYPSAQMHEVGHNFGYAHSSEGEDEYGDNSGMMGGSYRQDDGPMMCFNAVKSWQMGWFNDKRVNMNIGGTGFTDNCLETEITGQADYDAGLSQTILVKMNRSPGKELFLMYNKKVGINSGTQEGGNTVMIAEADIDIYEPSFLLEKLVAGDSASFANYLGDGRELVVTVQSISSTARVRIEFGGLCVTNPPKTPSPSSHPSSEPSSSPSSQPSSSSNPSSHPSPLPSSHPSSKSSSSPSSQPSSNPSSHLSLSSTPTPALPTPAPPTPMPLTNPPTPNDTPPNPPTTPSPTPNPTPAPPTPMPSNPPTPNPTPAPAPPTLSPTPMPSNPPTPNPTEFPTLTTDKWGWSDDEWGGDKWRKPKGKWCPCPRA